MLNKQNVSQKVTQEGTSNQFSLITLRRLKVNNELLSISKVKNNILLFFYNPLFFILFSVGVIKANDMFLLHNRGYMLIFKHKIIQPYK